MRYHEFFSKNCKFGACPRFWTKPFVGSLAQKCCLCFPMCTMLPQEQLQGPGMAVVLWQNTGLAPTPHPYRDRCHGSWWMVGEEIDVGHFLEKNQYPILLEIKSLEEYLRLAINHSGGLEGKFAMESVKCPSSNKQPEVQQKRYFWCLTSPMLRLFRAIKRADWGFNPTEGPSFTKVFKNGLFERMDQGIKLDRVETETHRYSPVFDRYPQLFPRYIRAKPICQRIFSVLHHNPNGRGLDV